MLIIVLKWQVFRQLTVLLSRLESIKANFNAASLLNMRIKFPHLGTAAGLEGLQNVNKWLNTFKFHISAFL